MIGSQYLVSQQKDDDPPLFLGYPGFSYWIGRIVGKWLARLLLGSPVTYPYSGFRALNVVALQCSI